MEPVHIKLYLKDGATGEAREFSMYVFLGNVVIQDVKTGHSVAVGAYENVAEVSVYNANQDEPVDHFRLV